MPVYDFLLNYASKEANVSLLFRSPEVTNNIPRPNLIPFTEPYAEGGSMHPGTRLKALQSTTVRKHPAIKPTSSTNEGESALER